MSTLDDPQIASVTPRSRDRLQGGAVLGRYRILAPLGRGGMSEVYAAYDPQLDRSVALKVMKLERGHEAQARLAREGRALARLGHRNVVVVHDVGVFEDELFVAMEHIKGTPLGPWSRAPQRTWSEVVAAFRQAAEALSAAHAAGVIHRDFKPANVMVENVTQRVVVLDFGLARLADAPAAPPSEPHTHVPTPSGSATHSAVGTLGYMAPELMNGDGASESTDQFAFCVSLYEALYGARPFVGRHVLELLDAMRTPLSAPHDRRNVPGWVHAVVVRGLALDPTDRFSSMRALLERLTPRERLHGARWLFGSGVVVAAGLGAWGLWESPRDPCANAGHDAIEASWDAQRRDTAREAMLDSGRPHAEDSAERVLARIDRFAAAWSDTATTACERRAHAPTAHANAMDACLSRGLDRLGAAVSMLERAGGDPTVADRALDLALSLPPIRRCLHEVPLSEGADADADAAVSDAIARSVAARVLGSREDAEAASERAVARSSTASAQLRVDALLERSRVADALARYDDALADAAAALALSTERELPMRQALASLEMVRITGDRLRRFDESARWEALARASLDRLPTDADLEAKARWVLGTVRWRSDELSEASDLLREAATAFEDADLRQEQSGALTELAMVTAQRGDHARARALLDHVLELRTELYGSRHPAVADTLADMASVQGRASNTHEALALGKQALAIYEDSVDPSHPNVATIVMNIGLEHRTQGRHDEALAAFARAESLRRQHFGDDHVLVAAVLDNATPSLLALDRLDDARVSLNEALKILDAAHGPDSAELLATLTNLGNLDAAQGNLDAALEHHTRAHEIGLAKLGPEHPSVGIGAHNIGDLWVQRGECQKARPYFERALAIFESALGPEVPEVAYPLTALGECATRAGRAKDGVRMLERALEVRTRNAIDPADRGKTALALAAARHALAPASPQAWAAAEQALVLFDEAGAAGDGLGEGARAWIADELGERPRSETPDSPAATVGVD
ncbi:MAG: tetratricopeptide repeat protein [Nannocystaceae bacterium]|nr:serine/threonine-protein kinase [bacterium]